jgi:hypothetical protein
MHAIHATDPLAERLERIRRERSRLEQQISLDQEEVISLRRALEKAETPHERSLLEERLGLLRGRLSFCHANVIQLHAQYDAARLAGTYAKSA